MPKDDWEKYYKETDPLEMPWFNPQLDQDFEAVLEEFGISSGRVLDVGSGPGTQVIQLTRRGFDAVGADLSPTAVLKARRLAEEKACAARFVQDNILETRLDPDAFDVVFDRGCFHTLRIETRDAYAQSIHKLLRDGAYLFLKCFSFKQPGNEGGPHRIRPQEIEDVFRSRFQILSIADSVFLGNQEPPPKALFCKLRKL